MSQGPLCPNLTQKVQKEVSQMANRNFSLVILLGGLSVNLNHLKTTNQSKESTRVDSISDKSNNNVGVGNDMITVNPDPSKYVLTKWGDVTVLGRRKLPAEVPPDTDFDFDGITVNIDHDDFEEEVEQDGPSTSSGIRHLSRKQPSDRSHAEAPISLGETSCRGNNNRSREVVEGDSGLDNLSEEEQKLLQENPHFQTYVKDG